MYQQCELRRENVTQTSFIPRKYAKIGKVLKIKMNDVWEDGWIVVAKYSIVDVPPDHNKAVREHKKRTGDSLPKRSGGE